MVSSLAEQPSVRLLKHIIHCYLRLSENQRVCEALKNCLPDILRDATFSNCFREDPAIRRRSWTEIVSVILKKSAKPLGRPMGGPPGGDRPPRGPHFEGGDKPCSGNSS